MCFLGAVSSEQGSWGTAEQVLLGSAEGWGVFVLQEEGTGGCAWQKDTLLGAWLFCELPVSHSWGGAQLLQ